MDLKSIQSPDGVALLMENLWLRHRAGMKQRENKVFMVELPSHTKEDLVQAWQSDALCYDQEELFGGFV